jgi:hypothetical protein
MGLFFDQDWFDDRLKSTGQSKSALAQAAGMSLDEVEMVFRDQRELTSQEVSAFARVLSADASEVAQRSGAADPGFAPQKPRGGMFEAAGTEARLGAPRQDLVLARDVVSGLHERLDRLERLVELVIRKLDEKR